MVSYSIGALTYKQDAVFKGSDFIDSYFDALNKLLRKAENIIQDPVKLLKYFFTNNNTLLYKHQNICDEVNIMVL